MSDVQVGIIGGSGLYDMPGLQDAYEVELQTPFGDPSDTYRVGDLEGVKVGFLARHGKGHRLLPTELNFQANVYGFKKLGVRRILSASAVGSLRHQYKPTDFVLPDQFLDRTYQRESTFFGEGVVAHIAFADPLCSLLADSVEEAGANIDFPLHRGGTYVCMEGPAFSTRAESRLYRSWGMDLIGMTNLQEARLAREAEICYVTIAMVTDYDSWHEEEEDVTVEMLIDNLIRNSANAKKLIRETVRILPREFDCPCLHALENAIITDPGAIPRETRDKLQLIIGKHLL
jgi:5'-methylthioadenosine phosphorylase